jgi:hypothetical protein
MHSIFDIEYFFDIVEILDDSVNNFENAKQQLSLYRLRIEITKKLPI